jgi:hypothetical protein
VKEEVTVAEQPLSKEAMDYLDKLAKELRKAESGVSEDTEAEQFLSKKPIGSAPEELDIPIELAIKPECLECPCFKVQGCSECDELIIGGMGVNDHRPGCTGKYPPACTPDDCVAAKHDLLLLQTNAAVCAIVKEWKTACDTWPPLNSRHEGYAVIKEELEELWIEIKRREPDLSILRKEAVQVAAMALRFILDLCPPDVTEDIKAELGIEDDIEVKESENVKAVSP